MTNPETELDTINDSLVGIQGDSIVFMRPIMGPLDKAKALRLAAWIVALADDDNSFPALLAAVNNT